MAEAEVEAEPSEERKDPATASQVAQQALSPESELTESDVSDTDKNQEMKPVQGLCYPRDNEQDLRKHCLICCSKDVHPVPSKHASKTHPSIIKTKGYVSQYFVDCTLETCIFRYARKKGKFLHSSPWLHIPAFDSTLYDPALYDPASSRDIPASSRDIPAFDSTLTPLPSKEEGSWPNIPAFDSTSEKKEGHAFLHMSIQSQLLRDRRL